MKQLATALSSILILGVTPALAAERAPNDAQIASIVHAANLVDIDAGMYAETQAKNPEVKKFAEEMVTDHSGVNRQAADLAKKLGVQPEMNPTADNLEKAGAKNLAHLKTLTGAAFDKAYIDHEVSYHQSVIDELDHTLIPSAKNAELKALLVKVRPAFVAHLEMAKKIESELKS